MGKNWLRLAVVLAVAIGCNYGSDLSGATSADVASMQRADVITIDTMTVFGPLEKPPVQFLHDAHTEALAQKNKDCATCHPTSKNNLIYPKFKRLEDTDRKAVMNIYHDECIACHGDMKVAGEKSGPVECGNCHKEKEPWASSRRPMGFDKSLHYRHAKTSNNQCKTCHHEYNEDEKKLYYAKGKEGTCRYCHQDQTIDNRISMRKASHLACINCHINPPVQPQNPPPKTCAGCHDPMAQNKIQKLSDVPRMERNQPDMVLLKSASKAAKSDGTKTYMPLVPFDHKTHEAANDNCRVCHHAGMQRCGECHTLYGIPDASTPNQVVTLERAMHQAGATQSCLGCHEANTQNTNCAGCHASMSPVRAKQPETCITCHSVPMDQLQASPSADVEISLARTALQSKKRKTESAPMDNLPEKVIIGQLSKEYEAVQFPHRQIVNALIQGIKDNPLSDFFHNGTETVCQGCHHHSPASPKPPQCSNCHFDQWDPATPSKPGIVAAYHQQCMGCHAQMKIEKPAGCIECHPAKHPG